MSLLALLALAAQIINIKLKSNDKKLSKASRKLKKKITQFFDNSRFHLLRFLLCYLELLANILFDFHNLDGLYDLHSIYNLYGFYDLYSLYNLSNFCDLYNFYNLHDLHNLYNLYSICDF